MTRKSILPLTCLSLFLSGAAYAQEIMLEETDWAVECRVDICSLTRSMFEADNGSRFFSVSLALSAGGSEAQLAIFTPLGTAVQKPLTFSAASMSHDYMFKTCTQEGCVVLERLPLDELNNLTILPAASFSFFAAEGDTPVKLDFPLAGLGDAIATASKSLGQN